MIAIVAYASGSFGSGSWGWGQYVVHHRERDLIGELYDAALGHRSWEDVKHSLVAHVDGRSLMLSVHDFRKRQVEVVTTVGMSGTDLQQYAEYYAQHDLWARGALEKRLFGRAISGSEAVDDRVFEGSLIYNEFLRPKLSMHHLAGALVALDGDQHVVVGIHRPRDADAYGQSELRLLGGVLPHLQRALEVRHRLRQADVRAQSLLLALDKLDLGVILLGGSGRLIHANLIAEALLKAGDGLTVSHTGLHAANKADDKRLQEAVHGALQVSLGITLADAVPGGHFRLRRRSGRHPLAVLVAPVGPDTPAFARDSPAVLIFVSDPARQIAADLATLKEAFGFPPAEARIVLGLASGASLPDLARQQGLSYNTARTLLARAMERSETRSQMELVRLLLLSLAPFRGSTPRGPEP
jgi:DNA-binding CsgD family transcriptional regulator